MRQVLFSAMILAAFISHAQDRDRDVSEVNRASEPLAHLLNLFTIHGTPQNQNENDKLTILVNHGYCLGFSKTMNQPRWAAYQVSKVKEGVDYERFPFFADDSRLPEENRIGDATFGDNYDRGHLVPNAAINKQYGKMAQMESFLMSNISPQRDVLNQGVWQKLEAAIRDKFCTVDPEKKHLWVVVGPVFSAHPRFLTRSNGVKVAVPEAFYCILSRGSDYLAFIFPQDVTRNQPLDETFLVSIDEVEKRTGLNFFPQFAKAQEKRVERMPAEELWPLQ